MANIRPYVDELTRALLNVLHGQISGTGAFPNAKAPEFRGFLFGQRSRAQLLRRLGQD
jgi:hypothetical protein